MSRSTGADSAAGGQTTGTSADPRARVLVADSAALHGEPALAGSQTRSGPLSVGGMSSDSLVFAAAGMMVALSALASGLVVWRRGRTIRL